MPTTGPPCRRLTRGTAGLGALAAEVPAMSGSKPALQTWQPLGWVISSRATIHVAATAL
jgi:hypothetical protein